MHTRFPLKSTLFLCTFCLLTTSAIAQVTIREHIEIPSSVPQAKSAVANALTIPTDGAVRIRFDRAFRGQLTGYGNLDGRSLKATTPSETITEPVGPHYRLRTAGTFLTTICGGLYRTVYSIEYKETDEILGQLGPLELGTFSAGDVLQLSVLIDGVEHPMNVTASSPGPEGQWRFYANYTKGIPCTFYAEDLIDIYVEQVLDETEAVVDLAVDSDNDGDIDADDEAAEYDPNRLGALVSYNADDDNENDIPDYDDTTGADDDLEPLLLSLTGTPGPNDLARLRTLQGEANIRLWADANRSTPITLPHELPASALPVTYYVEGIAWDDVTTVLTLELEDDQGQIFSEDTAQLYSGVLDLGLPEEVIAGTSPSVGLSGLPDATEVTFTVFENDVEVTSFVGTTSNLVAGEVLTVSTTPGDRYRVEATADDGALVLTSPEAAIVPGPAASITFSVSETQLPSDDFAQSLVTLTAFDELGNPVRDETPVAWTLSEFGQLLDAEVATVNGQATALLRSGPFSASQALFGLVDGLEQSTTIENYPVSILLTSTATALEAGTEDTATITATVTDPSGLAVPDGTPISWFTQKGTLIAQNSVVTGGVATAILQASGNAQQAGPSTVAAYVGNNLGRLDVAFEVPTTALYVDLDRQVLIGDHDKDHKKIKWKNGQAEIKKAGKVDVEQFDGSKEKYDYFTQTGGVVLNGTPNGQVVVRFAQPTDGQFLLYSETDGPGEEVIVELNGAGEGYFAVEATGAFTDEYLNTANPEGLFLKIGIEAVEVGAPAKAGEQSNHAETQVAVLQKDPWGRLLDWGKSFIFGGITGEGEDVAAIMGDITLSSLPIIGIIADGRDVIKEVVKLVIGGDFNYLTLTFALAGLVAETPFLKLADPIFAIGKAISKQLTPGTAFIKSFARYMGKAIVDLADGNLVRIRRIGGCLLPGKAAAPSCMITDLQDPIFRTYLERVFAKVNVPLDQFGQLAIFYERLEEIAGTAERAKELLRGLPEAYHSTIGTRADVTRRFVEIFNGDLANGIVSKIKTLNRLDEVAKGMIGGRWGSAKVADEYLLQAEELIATNPGALSRFEEFIDVPGSGRLLSRTSNSPLKGIANEGVQAELRAAQILSTDFGPLEEFGKKVGKADVDLVFENAAVEVKGGNLANELNKLKFKQLDKLSQAASTLGKQPVLAIPDRYRGSSASEVLEVMRECGDRGILIEYFPII